MNTNEKELNSKIAIWLGLIQDKLAKDWWFKDNIGYRLDFLHDRNQQKWIEDKLIELGYGIMYDYIQSNTSHNFTIYLETEILSEASSESRDIAFLSAVEQLIDAGIKISKIKNI